MSTSRLLLSAGDVVAQSVPYADVSRPQVYFLIDGGQIVYVGKSMRPMSRLHVHAAEGKRFDRVTFIECRNDAEACALEFAYICKFEPKFNSVLSPIPGVMPFDRGRKAFGFGRVHLKKARKAGLVNPVYEGRLGTWITDSDAQVLAAMVEGA